MINCIFRKHNLRLRYYLRLFFFIFPFVCVCICVPTFVTVKSNRPLQSLSKYNMHFPYNVIAYWNQKKKKKMFKVFISRSSPIKKKIKKERKNRQIRMCNKERNHHTIYMKYIYTYIHIYINICYVWIKHEMIYSFLPFPHLFPFLLSSVPFF